MVLPAEEHAEDIKTVIDQHETVIICGQTGCGKSTIIPQILFDEEGLVASDKCIAVTQPRRVAAAALAVKMAKTRGSEVGEEIGYKFRFENKTDDKTRLIYMTDGMLLKEYAYDQDLRKYGCIVLDEVHERSIASDILMWCLRQVQIKRNETRRKLKLVLMSATMDLEPLKKFFNAPAFYIPGRTFKVELFYCDKVSLKQNEHVDATIQTVVQLHEREPIEHAFLVFLTGQDEIEATARAIKQKLNTLRNAAVIPFYAQRQGYEFDDVFKVLKNMRKIIVATNIAETSITIPDVHVVIDAGKVKQRHFIHERRFSVLEVMPISKAQAIQRAGRAGRCANGKCYRLYSKAAYDTLEEQTTPEILRTSLSEVLFNLFSADINSPKRCKLLDTPSEDEWCSALDELIALELIEAFDKDSKVCEKSKYFALDNHERFNLTFELTDMGRKVKKLPLSPMLARFIYVAHQLKCIHEATILAAFCSTDDFILPIESMDQETKTRHDQFMRTFNTPEGDHIRVIEIYRVYKKQGSRKARSDWGYRNGFNSRRLEEVHEIRRQLRYVCENELDMKFDENAYSDGYKTHLRQALTQSFYLNVCTYSNSESCYRTITGAEQVYMHPSSQLNRQYPTTVIYTELVRTQKMYMRMATTIDRKDVEGRLKDLNIFFKLFKRDGADTPHKRGSSIKDLKNF
ncbi:hypothetical protein M3Y97_00120000 [Aphelenchoides bicaudatus]|nr:hypothetical protein M3Y97_00120000 [Aphelenchoides bicaudatus]